MITLFKNLLSECKDTKSFNNSLMNKDKILITQSYFSCRRPWPDAPRRTRRRGTATLPKGRFQRGLGFTAQADSTRSKMWFDSKQTVVRLEASPASTRSTPHFHPKHTAAGPEGVQQKGVEALRVGLAEAMGGACGQARCAGGEEKSQTIVPYSKVFIPLHIN